MAWPSTPLTSYLANSTPAIKAFDLNSFQSGINGIINATYDLQGVVLTNGTPGTVVTPTLGALIAARGVNSTTVPTPNAMSAGEANRDTSPAAAVYIQADGTLLAGFGIHSITVNALGDLSIVFQRPPSAADINNAVIQVTLNDGTFFPLSITRSLVAGNRLQARVAYSPTGDPGANIVAWIF